MLFVYDLENDDPNSFADRLLQELGPNSKIDSESFRLGCSLTISALLKAVQAELLTLKGEPLHLKSSSGLVP